MIYNFNKNHYLQRIGFITVIAASLAFFDLKAININQGYLIRQLNNKIIKQPNGPFAIMTFNEDSLGCYIGIIYYDLMSGPIDGAWRIYDRFWQEEAWCADVTSIYWGLSGKYLYVATSNIYGEGGLFELDLFNRIARRIFPSKKVIGHYYSIEIVNIYKDKNLLDIIIHENEKINKLTIRIKN